MADPASYPVWLITGSSTGIGLAITRHALSQGHNVIATSRNPFKTPDLVEEVETHGGRWLTLDVTSADVEETVKLAESLYGRIDVLVNNAAYAVLGSVEEVTVNKYRHQMETNFFGPVRVMKAVLPGMRVRRSGVIINMSSAQGIVAAPGNGAYAASKFAFEAVSEALSKEVAAFGLRVALLELGAFRTNFGPGADVVKPQGEYARKGHLVGERLRWISKLGELAQGDPGRAAEVVFEIAMGQEKIKDDGEGGTGEGFLRFVLGEDSFKVMSNKIDELRRTWSAQKEWCKRTALKG